MPVRFGDVQARPPKIPPIARALNDDDPRSEVFYVDEADVDLNPRIGAAWMPCGYQEAVPTPGQNQKRYIAGVLHAHTGRATWVEVVWRGLI